MELCLSISNCVAIDIWSSICSIHIDTNDLLSNRVTSGVSQFVLDRSCEASTVSASALPPVVTTQIPTLRTPTRMTSATTEYITKTPGIKLCYWIVVYFVNNISSKIVPLENGVVIYGANAVCYSLLYCLYYLWMFMCDFFPFCSYWLSLLYVYDMVQCNKRAWLIQDVDFRNAISNIHSSHWKRLGLNKLSGVRRRFCR